jgi:hypothetical protein
MLLTYQGCKPWPPHNLASSIVMRALSQEPVMRHMSMALNPTSIFVSHCHGTQQQADIFAVSRSAPGERALADPNSLSDLTRSKSCNQQVPTSMGNRVSQSVCPTRILLPCDIFSIPALHMPNTLSHKNYAGTKPKGAYASRSDSSPPP